MHAAELPNIVWEVRVCETPTVPVHEAVQGLGLDDSVRITVPEATPAPDMICPTTSWPDATAVTASAVPVMLAVTVPMEL
jgi:hypothetical protein